MSGKHNVDRSLGDFAVSVTENDRFGRRSGKAFRELGHSSSLTENTRISASTVGYEVFFFLRRFLKRYATQLLTEKLEVRPICFKTFPRSMTRARMARKT